MANKRVRQQRFRKFYVSIATSMYKATEGNYAALRLWQVLCFHANTAQDYTCAVSNKLLMLESNITDEGNFRAARLFLVDIKVVKIVGKQSNDTSVYQVMAEHVEPVNIREVPQDVESELEAASKAFMGAA